jgi:DNA primase
MSEAPDISTILEYYGADRVPTRKGWAKMKCPFHEDSHASAAVNLDSNIFRCHGCQMKGDGFSLIKAKEGVEFREAVSIASRILNEVGKVLPQRNTRSGGLPRRTGYHAGTSNESQIGRRARAANGS